MNFLERKLRALQRNNYRIDFPELFSDSSIEPTYLPDSSLILSQLLVKFRASEKLKGFGRFEDLLGEMLEADRLDKSYVVILPGHFPQQSFVYTKYPALTAKAAAVLKVTRNFFVSDANIDFLGVFASDWSCGLVLDVYAGNPEIHGSDNPVREISMW